MSIYQEIILDHYQFPHNRGTVPDAHGTCTLSNPDCGDMLTVTLKVDGQQVDDCKFDGQACAISTASASLLTDHIKQMSITQIRDLTGDDVLQLLQIDLSPIRLKCALLPLEAIQKALNEVK